MKWEVENIHILQMWFKGETSDQTINVRAGKFLGVRRIFAQISANLLEKNPKIKQTGNDCISLGARQFKHHAQIAPKPAQIYPNFPENN